MVLKSRKLLKGVEEMDNIRQLNASHSANASQVDNVRRMLLAMVDDFRCVIIKLAERITFLRNAENHFVKKKSIGGQRMFQYLCPIGEPFRYRSIEMGA